MAGFFKLPHELYRALARDPSTFRVYCELASRARWSVGTCLGSHGIVQLAVGQCVIGRAEIAAALDLTERAVRTALDRLSRLRAVTVESTKRGTVVTVHENWGSADMAPSERPSIDTSNDQAPAGQTAISTTINEEARREEGKKEDRKARAKRSNTLPSDWAPRDLEQALARELEVDIEREQNKFRDHHTAKRSLFADWNAAFRTWLRNSAEWSTARRGPTRTARGAAPVSNAHPESEQLSTPFGANR